MLNKWALALALGTVAIAGGASAQHSPRGGAGLMHADADHDGVVTRAEYTAQVDARFARMDANGNGVIDNGEGRQRRGMTAGDGATRASLSKDEFRARAMTRFDRTDANRDGRIDRAEVDAATAAFRQRAGAGTPGATEQ